MNGFKKSVALLLALATAAGLSACDQSWRAGEKNILTDYEYIEQTLNLANNKEQKWTYDAAADAWILSSVTAVAYPELPDQQGVSVCVPGAYVTGIDLDGDKTADITAAEAEEGVNGSLVIDDKGEITSTNGQVYTAATAPVILNTGAEGYGSKNNTDASTSYEAQGYINVSCGNRGKQDTATDEEGNTYYTGDAPSCLVDQKAAARYVKYNILLGNLPGNADYLISTGGSGGGAHAVMFAATGNNPDFYDYLIEAGAVGVYQCEDGSYTTTVCVNGMEYDLSDGVWGCIAYSPITSLAEADMALAFEYHLNTEYSFSTPFQAQLAEYLSESYMEYINQQNLSVLESKVGFDLNNDADTDDTIALTIEYDPQTHPETNGYYGTYLDLYLKEFTENLQWYLDNIDYTQGWTWFDSSGNALSDEEVAAMTSLDKGQALIEGRYTAASSGGRGGRPGGDFAAGGEGSVNGGRMGGPGGGQGMDSKIDDLTGGSDAQGGQPGRDPAGGAPGGETPPEGAGSDRMPPEDRMPSNQPGDIRPEGPGGASFGEAPAGTPDRGTTQSNTGSADSANYETYEDMVAAYKADIEEILAGDEYGNNIVSLYNPLNYIGAEDTEDPTWTRIVMGASEGDISLFNSLNLQLAWLNAGVDAEIEWQWNGGHVPSEILGESFGLVVDQMYGEYVSGAETITKQSAEKQTVNGTSTQATGTDISGWVTLDSEGNVSFGLKDIAAYRTNGASKAMPGFDVIDYGQEDYVFGDENQDARHWNVYLLDIFQTHADVLEPLFQTTAGQ